MCNNYPARVRSRGKVIMLGRGIYVNLKRPLQADSPHHYPMEGSSCSLFYKHSRRVYIDKGGRGPHNSPKISTKVVMMIPKICHIVVFGIHVNLHAPFPYQSFI